MKNAKRHFKAAVYVRLSKEDGDVADAKKAESNIISNQKSLVFHFLEGREDIEVVSVHEDDGYTGSNFDRPGFRRMMEEIETGKADCVVVKDLSRFGREYIAAGNYIQRVFPALGVRFIAINDNVDTIDTLNPVNDVVIPFKNLVNDAFCADTSIKTRSQLDAKRRAGSFVGNFCAYGYMKSPDNHNRLVPDPFAADVVRDIFKAIREGMTADAVGKMLNDTGILSPMEYKRSKGLRYACNFKKHDRCLWSAQAVLRIAKNPVYTGTLVQGRVSTPNHKVKRRVQREGDDLITVRDAHEALISERDFAIVQRLLATDLRAAPGKKKVYPLSGLCRCADCGAPMVRKTSSWNGKTYGYYICSDHKRYGDCSPHSISEIKLEQEVGGALSELIGGMVPADEMMEKLRARGKNTAASKKAAERIRANEDELEKCERMLVSLYEDFREGIVEEKDFSVIKKNLTLRRHAAENAAKRLAALERKDAEKEKRLKEQTAEFEKYKGIRRFDRAMLVSLVREVRVHEGGNIEVVLDCDDEFKVLLEEKGGGREATDTAEMKPDGLSCMERRVV